MKTTISIDLALLFLIRHAGFEPGKSKRFHLCTYVDVRKNLGLKPYGTQCLYVIKTFSTHRLTFSQGGQMLVSDVPMCRKKRGELKFSLLLQSTNRFLFRSLSRRSEDGAVLREAALTRRPGRSGRFRPLPFRLHGHRQDAETKAWWRDRGNCGQSPSHLPSKYGSLSSFYNHPQPSFPGATRKVLMKVL